MIIMKFIFTIIMIIRYYLISKYLCVFMWNYYSCFLSPLPSLLPQSPSEELKVLIEQAAHQLSAETTELACAFIQKTAVEKAIPEIDKRLAEVSECW